jgi:phosphatidylglycerophosphate synthase
MHVNEQEKGKLKRDNQRRILGRFIEGPVNYLMKHKIKPNLISLFGFSFSLAAAFFVAIGGLHFPILLAWIVPFLLFWAGAFDVFDGEVARRTDQDSNAGAFLDSNLDRISDVALVYGMIFANLITYLMGYIIIFLIIMISYIRARAEIEGLDLKGVGFMERAERLIILWFAFIVEFWVYYITRLFYPRPSDLFFNIFIIFYTILLIITVFQRVIFSFRSLYGIRGKD